jgi:polyisoprenoid-binding protein YceI
MSSKTEGGPPVYRTKRIRWLTIPLVLVVGGAVFLVWFFGRTVPDEASLDAAGSVTTTTSEVVGSDTTVATEGTWTIDTSIGEFSFAEATSTFAGFRVNEELSGFGSAVAVGRTPDVTGTLVIQEGVVTTASIEVDLSSIVSNQSRRDSRVQRALNTSEHPRATFVLNEPIELGTDLATGETFAANATGQLTIKGITKSVTIPLEGTFVDGSVLLAGGIDLTFADFDVEVPSAPIVLSAEDHGILEVQLWFTPA